MLKRVKDQLNSVNKIHLWYTIALLLDNFGFGASEAIFGSTLSDLQKIYNVQQRTMSLIYIVQSAGYVGGTLIGLLYRWLNRQLTITIFSLLIALTTALTPLYAPLWVAFVCITVQGFSMGVYDSSNPIWYLEMWPEQINFILQLSQFMFGLGTIVAPLISVPFVIGKDPLPRGAPESYRMNQILIPYVIVGVFQAIGPLILLFLFFNHRYHKPELDVALTTSSSSPSSLTSSTNNCEMDSSQALPYTPNRVTIHHRKSMLTFSCVFFSVYYCAENGYLPYCTNMWQSLLVNLTSEEANMVMSLLSAFYTIGSLVTAFVSVRHTPDCILSYHYVIMMVGFMVMYCGQRSRWFIYIGSSILGYGFSCMQGIIFSFVNEHFTLTYLVTSVYLFIANIATTTVSVIIFMYPLEQNPEMLFYLVSTFIVLSLVCFIAIELILFYTKHNNNNNKDNLI